MSFDPMPAIDTPNMYASVADVYMHRVEQLMRELAAVRKDAERSRFLKSRISVPGAIHHFLASNNWHPDTDIRDIDAAIDAAMK
jgi:hypothetical protein